MKQFDICRTGKGRDNFVLIVQCDYIDEKLTRVVAPLLLAGKGYFRRHPKLNPDIIIAGKQYIIAFDFMMTMRVSELSEAILSFESRRSEVSDAIDFLLQGF